MSCDACTNGIIRSLGRDNDEIIEDCPYCMKTAPAIDPLRPKTYLPACSHCTPEDSSPDENVCENCQGVFVACESCRLIIRSDCKCGAFVPTNYFHEV